MKTKLKVETINRLSLAVITGRFNDIGNNVTEPITYTKNISDQLNLSDSFSISKQDYTESFDYFLSDYVGTTFA